MSSKPYVREMSKTTWFLSQPRYKRYMAREVTCIFIFAYTFLLIVALARLAQGPDAFQEFLDALRSPLGVLFNVAVLIASSGRGLRLVNNVIRGGRGGGGAPGQAGRTGDDAVMAMASAYRSYAHHHPGRYSAFTRMPLGGDDPEFTAASHAAAAPVIDVLASYGLDGPDAFCAALEFWAALHGFVLLEMTGVMESGAAQMGAPDADAVFADMVLRLATGMGHRRGQS